MMNNHGDLTITDFIPKPFPIPDIHMITPFWADADTTGTGYVWYRATNDTTLLAKATNDIPYTLSRSEFNPIWLLIYCNMGSCWQSF